MQKCWAGRCAQLGPQRDNAARTMQLLCWEPRALPSKLGTLSRVSS